MAISTDLYRAFYGVGLHLSFSKAAKAAGVSQSAISQSVKLLEKELKITLFERTTKSVAFTPEGRELFEAVAGAFSMLDNGVAQLQERLNHGRESLRIAATDTLCRYELLPYFKKWQEMYSDIGLQIINRASRECIDMIEEEKAQLAIVNSYEGILEHPQLELIEIGTMQDVFVGGPAYKNKGIYSVEDIVNEPVLLLESRASSRMFFEKLVQGYMKAPAFELENLEVLVDLIEINMGISLVPDILVKDKIKAGKLVELKTELVVPPRKIYIARSRLQPLSSGAMKFIDLLVK